MLNVVVAVHQPIFRAGVANLLAAEDDFRIIAQPLSGDHLRNAIDKLYPNVVILSSGFLAGPAEISALAKVAAERRFGILALTESDENSSDLFSLGVQGVLYRSVSGDTLVDGVRLIARGEVYMQTYATKDARIGNDLIGQRVTSRFSRRELRIISAVVQGYKNRDIAEQFGMTVPLVKKTISVIYDKTGVSGRLELALFVIHHQVLASAAAKQPVQDQVSRYAGEDRAGRAVNNLFYPLPRSGRSPGLRPNRPHSGRNHDWHHPLPPDCGK